MQSLEPDCSRIPEECGIEQALLWIDHGESPMAELDFMDMGDVPHSYRDLKHSREKLFRALYRGKLKAEGVFFGTGPLDDKVVVIPRTHWIWERVNVKTWTLQTPDWQKENLGHYGCICIKTADLFKIFPLGKQSQHNDSEPADASPDKQVRLERRGRPSFSWEELFAAIAVKADFDGLPEKQAELEELMLQWCERQWGKQPAISTIRQKISLVYQARAKGKAAYE